MVDLGYIALVIAFAISAYTAVAAFLSTRGYPELWRSARMGGLVAFGLTTLAAIALVNAFVTRDFSVQYVAQYSDRDLDIFFTIAAWWAGQAGSILLWAWILAIFVIFLILQNKAQHRELLPHAIGVMTGILTFFLGVMVFAANPFERSAIVPADGQGLNPMLQNMGMLFHPTTLYLGYVGFTVPFAFAIAALITGRLGDEWIRSTRRWTLFAWFFLGMGNLFGAQWAYVELGWGGYWGWDPVEAASFMPWLVGTAYLHSVMIQQRRGMLKVWNLVLIIITFILSIFGTLLTRSGILSSVHTFSQSAVGPLFIALIGLLLVFSFGLLFDRLPRLKSDNELDSLVSREASFLINNLLLVGIAFAIFWGTVFPLISEAVRGVKITVGPPFFSAVTGPIFLAMVIVMGICPLIGWRKATPDNLLRNFLYPMAGAVVLVPMLFVIGVRAPYALAAFAASGFVVGTLLLEFVRGVRARHRSSGQNYVGAFFSLVWGNKPRYGGYVIHLGIVLIAIGVAASQFYGASVEETLSPGESINIRQYTVTYKGMDQFNTRTRRTTIANLDVSENGKKIGTMTSSKYF
ncbi:MAG: heme lyase CcmF/NrfE family subunit, partial [Dehalococcoidia bacterium]|nr:heme lyase CcmF/NrfE family subunit [Dehalococcoidia bacterium]